MSVSSCFFIHKILPLPRGYIVKACSVVTKSLLLCGNPHIKEWQNKIELLISIYEISRALVFIYGISGCSRCLGMVTRWAFRKEVKCRAATSIGNTDFLSVTDFFAQKGGKLRCTFDFCFWLYMIWNKFWQKKCFLTLCMTLWLCEDEHFK